MRRVGSPRSFDEQIAYHLADGRAPDFSVGQRGRVQLARFLADKILLEFGGGARIVELGCGAGDISGPYSLDNEVFGYDITDAAGEACRARWPHMHYEQRPVEGVEPFDCDLLILTEVLEHLDDPTGIVSRWLPRAKWAIIGHPLNEPDPPIEPGHIWSYTREDWRNWFVLGGHQVWEEFRFPMGGWDEMILGHSSRR